jgi:hypothetical protein
VVHREVSAFGSASRRALAVGTLALAALVAAGARPHQKHSINSALLRPGDLLFRTGDSAQTAAVVAAEGGGWSHVGIVVRSASGGLELIHASPADEPGEFYGVRRESLEEFARHAYAIGAYRPQSDSAAAYAAARAEHYLGRHFDAQLDAESDAEIYCTELVTDAFAGSGLSLDPGRTRYTVPLLGTVSVISPNALAAMSALSRVL